MMHTLLQLCIGPSCEATPSFLALVSTFPPHLKDKLLRHISKRGLITHHILQAVIHKDSHELDLSECDVDTACLNAVAAVSRRLYVLKLPPASHNHNTDLTQQAFVDLFPCAPLL